MCQKIVYVVLRVEVEQAVGRDGGGAPGGGSEPPKPLVRGSGGDSGGAEVRGGITPLSSAADSTAGSSSATGWSSA